MGFWVQVAEWVLSSKEDLLGQLQGCLEGDARDPLGWVLPVLLVLLPGDCRLPMGLREDRNTILCDQGDPSAYLPHLKESLLTLEMYSVLGLGIPLPGCPCGEGTRAGPVGSSAKKVKLRRAQESLPALVSKDGWGGRIPNQTLRFPSLRDGVCKTIQGPPQLQTLGKAMRTDC